MVLHLRFSSEIVDLREGVGDRRDVACWEGDRGFLVSDGNRPELMGRIRRKGTRSLKYARKYAQALRGNKYAKKSKVRTPTFECSLEIPFEGS